MMPSTQLPEDVLVLLKSFYGATPIEQITPTIGGFSNLSAILTVGGQQQVVKAATLPQKRADLRREAHLLDQLHGQGLPTPQLLTLIEAEAWSIEILECLPGENGVRLFSSAPEQLAQLYTELGRLLGRLHSFELAVPEDPDLLLAARSQIVLERLPTLALEPALEQALVAALQHPVWQSKELRLTHGDPGAHNLLWDRRVTAFLDWEWAGWGEPVLDLAWVGWTMRFRQVPEQVWLALLEEYRQERPARFDETSETLRQIALGQIAGILVRVANQPLAYAEWLRRARWTRDADGWAKRQPMS